MKILAWIRKQSKKSRRILQRRRFFLIAAVISILLTIFLGWFSQYLYISEFLKRANAEVAAPIIGNQYLKDRNVNSNLGNSKKWMDIPSITIVKITDADLNAADTSYPPSHRFHARKLEDLLELGTPKALFIDILFLDKRSESSQLRNALCELRKVGTKIYIASIFPESELASDFKGFTQPANATLVWPKGSKACDLLAAEVSVRKQRDEFTNQAWGYCLDESLPEIGKLTGNNKCQHLSRNVYGIKNLNSAAYQIYLDLGYPSVNLGDTSEMALTWGTERSIGQLMSERLNSNCRNSISFLDFIAWPNIIKGIFSNKSILPFCPYFDEVTISQLMRNENRESLIDGQIVLYGYQLDGINDFSYIPAHGIQHAMYVHAMALDNLLVYQKRAKSNKELFDSKGLLLFNVFLQIFIIFIASIFSNYAKRFKNKRFTVFCRKFPNMVHSKSLVIKVALLSISPILILPMMWVGSSLLNLGVMSWIDYALIGSVSEIIGVRREIEDEIESLFNHFKSRSTT